MPTVEDIIASVLGSNELDSYEVESQKTASKEKPSRPKPKENEEPSEAEKMASALEEMANAPEGEPEKEEPNTQEIEPASDGQIKKAAVAATVIDTLSSLDKSGVSEKSFKTYFSEKRR